MTRVAVYTDYRYGRDGNRVFAERAFALFLVALAPHLERLVIVGKVEPELGESHYELGEGVEFAELPYYTSLTAPRELARVALRATAAFWRVLDGVDAVWLLGPHPLGVVYAALARLRGRSVSLGVRQDFRRYVRARHPGRRWVHLTGDLLEGVWRLMARRSRMVAVGPELARQYPHARTLELTVSLVRCRDIRDAGDAAADFDGDVLYALSVGRLEQEKNPLLLADIAARLVRDDPRWRLIVCGEGPLDDALRERLAELGIADHVDLRGYVAHDRGLRDIYRSSHALLHVSWTEGLPQVLFEAFAARLPVVATAVGGVPSAAGDAALLIEPGDAGAAADALGRVAADPALRERLVAAGVNRVSAHTLESEAARVAAFITPPTR
jgi:glycosyltransferase involved in cell wall biosynthesis